MNINLRKHIDQIKNGGLIVLIKKLRSAFYLLIQLPFYLFSIPLLIIIYLLRPWLLIRWYGLPCGRIGHLALDAELYSCRRDAKINQPSQKYIDFFFLEHRYICNRQLVKMQRRSITILPAFLMVPLSNTNRFINLCIKGKVKSDSGKKSLGGQHEIDIFVQKSFYKIIMPKSSPHISFNEEEKLKGKTILNEFGIPENAKFVCLIVRDSAYLARHKIETLHNFSYHNYRDCDIDNFVLAAEELAARGYYVFRMGIKVHKPLKSSNPKIIDYANSKMRSDFMDIYLGANCTFCISTALGYDAIPSIFRKPVAYIYTPVGIAQLQAENDLAICKHHLNKKTKKKLTISEIFSSNVIIGLSSAEYENNNVELQENTPEEIKDLVTEMDERISGSWKETEEDLLLQKKFWHIFEGYMKKLIILEPENQYHRVFSQLRVTYDIKKNTNTKFSSKFLKNNLDFIQ
jgi:putative glycosyltransferase (TIGR04372 family)